MAADQSLAHNDYEDQNIKREQQSEQSPDSVQDQGLLAQEQEGAPLYPASLLNDPSVHVRGNRPVSTELMLQLQQTYGNRAVQRFTRMHATLPIGSISSNENFAVQREGHNKIPGGPAETSQPTSGDAQTIQEAKKALELEKRKRVGELVAEFLQTPNPQFIPSPNSPPANPIDYATSRVEQQERLSRGGVTDSAAGRAKAKASAQNLQVVLRDLIETCQYEEVTLQELRSRYESRLRLFDSSGVPVSSFIMRNLQQAFQRAEAQVKLELTRVNTTLGQKAWQIREMEKSAGH